MDEREFRMKVVISASRTPELFARLGEAKNPWHRSAMLKEMATLYLHLTTERIIDQKQQSASCPAAVAPDRPRTYQTDPLPAATVPSSTSIELEGTAAAALISKSAFGQWT
jgi:hypothetical protein